MKLVLVRLSNTRANCYFSCSWTLYKRNYIVHIHLCLAVLSLNIISVRFTHDVVWLSRFFPLLCMFHCIKKYSNLLIYSLVDGYLSYFQFGVVVNKWTYALISLWHMFRNEIDELWVKHFNRNFMWNNYTSGKCKLKPQWNPSKHSRIAKIKETEKFICWWECGRIGILIRARGSVNWFNCFGKVWDGICLS